MSDSLLQGDCLALLPTLPAESVDLVYLDPPFFTQRTHVGTAGSFSDSWADRDEYLTWMRDRLYALHRVLALTGTLYLHCDDHAASYLKVTLDGIFGVQLGEVIWKRSSGAAQGRRNGYVRVKDTILVYAKGPTWTWNDVPGSDDSLWLDLPNLNAQSKERTGWPTQKPEALLARIIEISSEPDDLVLDPFCGSGTTLAAAERLGRRWVGMDESSEAIALSAQRLGLSCEVAA